MSYVKLVGNKNPQSAITSITTSDGKTVNAGEPVDLPAQERKDFEERGFIFEDSSKSEANEVAADAPLVGGDVASAAPVFGDQDPTVPNQAHNDDDNDQSK